MIRFVNLTKTYRLEGVVKTVLDNVTMKLPSGKSIGLLGLSLIHI